MRYSQPGPLAIEPGRAPGGVVIHIYDNAGRRISEQMIGPGDDVEALAEVGARLIPEATVIVVLVAYDGDSGERFPPSAWLGAR